jgi:hypothetical protein
MMNGFVQTQRWTSPFKIFILVNIRVKTVTPLLFICTIALPHVQECLKQPIVLNRNLVANILESD